MAALLTAVSFVVGASPADAAPVALRVVDTAGAEVAGQLYISTAGLGVPANQWVDAPLVADMADGATVDLFARSRGGFLSATSVTVQAGSIHEVDVLTGSVSQTAGQPTAVRVVFTDVILQPTIRAVNTNGAPVDAEISATTPDVGVLVSQWIASTQTLSLRNGGWFTFYARDAGALLSGKTLQLFADTDYLVNVRTGAVTPSAGSGNPKVTLQFEATWVQTVIEATDTTGATISAELKVTTPEVGVAVNQWVATPQTATLRAGGSLTLYARDQGAFLFSTLVAAEPATTLEINVRTGARTTTPSASSLVKLVFEPQLLSFDMETVDVDGNVVAGEVLLTTPEVGIPVGQWVAAPQTGQLRAGGFVTFYAREGGTLLQSKTVPVSADTTVDVDAVTAAVTSRSTPGTTSIRTVFPLGRIDVPIRAVDTNGSSVDAEIKLLTPQVQLPTNQWIATPQVANLPSGGSLTFYARDEGGFLAAKTVKVYQGHTYSVNVLDKTVADATTPGTTEIVLEFEATRIAPTIVARDTAGATVAAEIKQLTPEVGMPTGQWVPAARALDLRDGGTITFYVRSRGEFPYTKSLQLYRGADYLLNVLTGAVTESASAGAEPQITLELESQIIYPQIRSVDTSGVSVNGAFYAMTPGIGLPLRQWVADARSADMRNGTYMTFYARSRGGLLSSKSLQLFQSTDYLINVLTGLVTQSAGTGAPQVTLQYEAEMVDVLMDTVDRVGVPGSGEIYVSTQEIGLTPRVWLQAPQTINLRRGGFVAFYARLAGTTLPEKSLQVYPGNAYAVDVASGVSSSEPSSDGSTGITVRFDVTLDLAPTALDRTVTTNENVGITIPLQASDPDNNPLTYTVLSQPTLGVLGLLQGSTINYSPTLNTSGTDRFTFRVNDGDQNSNVAVVTITIVPTNLPPTASAGPAVSVFLGEAASLDGSGSTDPDGDALQYTWDLGDGSTAAGVTPSHVYAAVGIYPVTLTVTDGKGGSGSAATSVTVIELPPPTIAAPPAVTVECGASTGPSVTGIAIASSACAGALTVGFEDVIAEGAGAPVVLVITRTWSATDACGHSASADQIITVVDATAPTVHAALVPTIGAADAEEDGDKRLFRVTFSASDGCDVRPALQALLVIAGWPAPIPVRDGDLISFEPDDECEVERKAGILEIEARVVTLRVSARDLSGNTGVAEASLDGAAGSGDDHGDDHEDDHGDDHDDDDQR